jgi:hypothetical protein
MAHHARFTIGDPLPRSFTDLHTDEQAGSVGADGYSVIGASVRGRLHQHNDIPRDDAFFVRIDGPWLTVAVADGAGSRPRSRYGASYVANALCKRMQRMVRISWRSLEYTHGVFEDRAPGATTPYLAHSSGDNSSPPPNGVQDGVPADLQECRLQDLVQKAFRETRAGLERFARIQGVELDELHSTLLGLILNTETGEVGIGQVGDGLILGLDEKRDPKIIASPPSTNDPSASYFITQDDWEQYLWTGQINILGQDPMSTLYLMTDGVSNDCQYGPPPDILRLWANDMDREIRLVRSLPATAERLKNYLGSYRAKGSFDDRTLVVIFRERYQ